LFALLERLRLEGKESQCSGPLHGTSDLPLVAGAVAGHTAGDDLPSIRDGTVETLLVFVVYEPDLVQAELAYLFARSSRKSARHIIFLL
jgi:hypothetical protein